MEPDFELDPRLPKNRTESDEWEDVGRLDQIDLEDVMRVLNRDHGTSLDKHSHLLEIGVGKARLFKRLKAQGYDIVGVEARKRKEHEGLPIAHIRIEEMPFSGDTATFDMIIASSVFDQTVYLQDQAKMLDRIAGALRPGGILITNWPLFSRMEPERYFEEVHLAPPYDTRHVYAHKRREL